MRYAGPFIAAAGVVAFSYLATVPRQHDRDRFVDAVASGIEIGYLCQARRMPLDECSADFRRHMAPSP